jgi:hypothetical protein
LSATAQPNSAPVYSAGASRISNPLAPSVGNSSRTPRIGAAARSARLTVSMSPAPCGRRRLTQRSRHLLSDQRLADEPAFGSLLCTVVAGDDRTPLGFATAVRSQMAACARGGRRAHGDPTCGRLPGPCDGVSWPWVRPMSRNPVSVGHGTRTNAQTRQRSRPHSRRFVTSPSTDVPPEWRYVRSTPVSRPLGHFFSRTLRSPCPTTRFGLGQFRARSVRSMNSSTENSAMASPMSSSGRSSSLRNRTHDLPMSIRLPVAS